MDFLERGIVDTSSKIKCEKKLNWTLLAIGFNFIVIFGYPLIIDKGVGWWNPLMVAFGVALMFTAVLNYMFRKRK